MGKRILPVQKFDEEIMKHMALMFANQTLVLHHPLLWFDDHRCRFDDRPTPGFADRSKLLRNFFGTFSEFCHLLVSRSGALIFVISVVPVARGSGWVFSSPDIVSFDQERWRLLSFDDCIDLRPHGGRQIV